ncbi:hypothetical protein GCM10009836_73530 [Pseudonocardia ailaonensis]|uniref:DUF3558 domain-containing protein n=1 Tax=Pseudonocardia ailaonensis TaxID=367279 RepID=A0ABN2NRY0_9PSEU
MRRLVLPFLLCVLLAVGSGCAVAVPGRAVAEPTAGAGGSGAGGSGITGGSGTTGATGAGGNAAGRGGTPAAVPPAAADGRAGGTADAAASRPTLVPDVLPDECLLDAAGFARLLGVPVATPATGGTPRSCTTSALHGTPRALASINVYRAEPAPVVRSGRALAGVGDAAAVVDTGSGPTLQVATGRYLVTLAVTEVSPTDERWAEAGRALVARIGGAALAEPAR